MPSSLVVVKLSFGRERVRLPLSEPAREKPAQSPSNTLGKTMKKSTCPWIPSTLNSPLFRAFVGGMLRAVMLLGLTGTVAVSQSLEYPRARRSDVVDDYFGTKVPDPYRWLEDTDSPETQEWVKAENEITSAYSGETG